MSLVYLALGIALLLATIAAWSPRVFVPFRALAGFTGMAVTLLLPQVLIIGALTAAVFGHFGAFEKTPGVVGLGLHLVSWAALLVLQHRMNRARPLLDGEVVADTDTPFGEPPAPDETPWVPTFGPSLSLRTRVLSEARIEKNIEFHRAGRSRLVLDIYRPPEGSSPKPAIVYIHGGGWISGSRKQSRFMCAELAARGFPVFAISYRFALSTNALGMLADCKAGLAWVRAKQREYGADDRTLVMGGSAGGHLAAMVALTSNEKRFQPGFEDADTTVHGAVILYGVTDLTGVFSARKDPLFGLYLRTLLVRSSYATNPELWAEVEPLSWASKNAPPMLFVHGLSDGVVPVTHSRLLIEKLRDAGATQVHLLEVPLAHHAFEVMPTMAHQRAVRVISAWCLRLARGDDASKVR